MADMSSFDYPGWVTMGDPGVTFDYPGWALQNAVSAPPPGTDTFDLERGFLRASDRGYMRGVA